jgi:hypothetical protein
MCALAGSSRPDQPQYMHSILLVALWLMNASQSQFACVRTFGLLLLLLLLCLCSSDGPLILWMIAHVLFPPLCPQNNSQPASQSPSVSEGRESPVHVLQTVDSSTRGVWRLSSFITYRQPLSAYKGCENKDARMPSRPQCNLRQHWVQRLVGNPPRPQLLFPSFALQSPACHPTHACTLHIHAHKHSSVWNASYSAYARVHHLRCSRMFHCVTFHYVVVIGYTHATLAGCSPSLSTPAMDPVSDLPDM